MLYELTRRELRKKKASEFVCGDMILTGPYLITIRYQSRDGRHKYDRPALCSYHERRYDSKPCGCTPGADRPYYIDDFLNR